MLEDYDITTTDRRRLKPTQKLFWDRYPYNLMLSSRDITYSRRWFLANHITEKDFHYGLRDFRYTLLDYDERKMLKKLCVNISNLYGKPVSHKNFYLGDYFRISKGFFLGIYFETKEEFNAVFSATNCHFASATIPFSDEHLGWIKKGIEGYKFSTRLFKNKYWYRYSVINKKGLPKNTPDILKDVLGTSHVQFHGGGIKTTVSIYTNDHLDNMMLTLAGGGTIKRTKVALIGEDGSIGGIDE